MMSRCSGILKGLPACNYELREGVIRIHKVANVYSSLGWQGFRTRYGVAVIGKTAREIPLFDIPSFRPTFVTSIAKLPTIYWPR